MDNKNQTTISYLVSQTIYEIYFSPLAKFPGPFLWKISKIPLQSASLNGRVHLKLTAFHDCYGPIVRISPNELAFNSPQAFRDIYGSPTATRTFLKERTHYLPATNGADHLISAVDNSVHARHRRLLSHAFSDRALREQQDLVTEYVDKLMQKLSSSSSQAVDIKSWLDYTFFDLTGELIFGESFQCLDSSELHPWIALVFNSVKALMYMSVFTQFPWLNAVLQRLIPASLRQQERDHFDLAAAKMERRLKMGVTERSDFMSSVLRNGFVDDDVAATTNSSPEKVLSRAELHSNSYILITVGSETSATLLSGCVYYLSKTPNVLQKLTDEIRSTFSVDSEINFANSAKLTYLSAVIEESLRMYPPLVMGLPRMVASGGGVVDGHFLPEGTQVSCHHYASYHSKANFALPNEFIPERWLGDARFQSDKKDVLQPFSLGPRNCLGKNLAYAEIRLVLCKLVLRFNVKLCAESRNWVDQEIYFIWEKPELMVKLEERPHRVKANEAD
ncbi:Isotrichodermin C-15 hydroxylase [Talaromyces islandicus]|uniref:Isotrichodermin C-15 hydroxylase n=1 Tax=Talaromyces islandicus TaxID=28573 RepID=A0A0U1LJZ5_TALIS|nr:Isotrichodermin C-15 hydroxylase [Talaromyces islandicus]